MNHPALTLAYRLETGGATLVYAVDHEPPAGYQSNTANSNGAGARTLPVHQEDRRHIEFLAGADLVIHDVQYTAEEYERKAGWGHSPVEYAVDVALAAQAKRLGLFHHDPLRDDEALDRLVQGGRQRVATCGGGLEVFGAAEGQVIELPERQVTPPRMVGHVGARRPNERSQGYDSG